MNNKFLEYFSLEQKVILSNLPKGKVSIIIPESFINRNTGEIYVDKYILWLAESCECNMVIEYEK